MSISFRRDKIRFRRWVTHYNWHGLTSGRGFALWFPFGCSLRVEWPAIGRSGQ